MQSAEIVQARRHCGYTPSYPDAQLPQLLVASKETGQTSHDDPAQLFSHEQLQPVPTPNRPETALALPLQSREIVQTRVQFGAVPLNPSSQNAQFVLALVYCGQVAHVGPVHALVQLQVQPTFTSPSTLKAWPLQSVATEHCSMHNGYPPAA